MMVWPTHKYKRYRFVFNVEAVSREAALEVVYGGMKPSEEEGED